MRRLASAFILLATLAVAGCSSKSGGTAPPFVYRPFLGLVPSTAQGAPQDSLVSAVLTAQATGVDFFYYSARWSEFQTGPGQYQTGTMRAALSALQGAGFHLYVNLHTIETNQRAVPAALNSLAFDDPQMMAWADTLVDTLIQVAKEHPLVAIALGNEVDVYFGAHPAEFAGFKTLFQRETNRIHAALPALLVGCSTTSPISNPNTTYGQQLNAIGDIAIYTYYPFAAATDFQHRAPSTLEPDMTTMQSVAGKLFALQEIGYSSSPVNCSVSPANPGTHADSVRADSLQADFVRRFRAWQAGAVRSSCLFADWFLYTDIPSAQVDTLVTFYGVGTPGFRGYLSGLGLRRADGTPKRSWNAWRGLP